MSAAVRAFVIVLLAVAVLAPAGSIAQAKTHRPAAHLARACPDADLVPAAGNLRRIRAAIVCLHNEVRGAHRLRRLRQNRPLRKAAVGHSRNMVAGRFFDHSTPAGVTMVERDAQYLRNRRRWMLGENLGWGTGSLATPLDVVRAWLESAGHRANILNGAYRDIGVGVVLGVPVSGAAGATYTVDFGVRR